MSVARLSQSIEGFLRAAFVARIERAERLLEALQGEHQETGHVELTSDQKADLIVACASLRSDAQAVRKLGRPDLETEADPNRMEQLADSLLLLIDGTEH
jgi:hypothetical protein